MRLERLDPYLKSFTGRVVQRRTGADGTWLRLDRSAFYPTSGGQPHDTGTLAGRPIVDVALVSGAVWHRLGGDYSEGDLDVGSEVTGVIDWARRFTHMQRHSGQHLLSQAFVRVGLARGAEYATRSVSLRGPVCTLDLSGEPDDEALAAVEAEADRAARQALPIVAFEVDDSRLGDYRLRRPAKVSGLVRLVAILDYDLVACGGTHVRSSAELLPLKVLAREKGKGDLTRVTFSVGAEALADYALKHAVTARLASMLSAPVEELPARTASLHELVAEAQRELVTAQQALAADEAGAMLEAADTDALPGRLLIAEVLEAGRSVTMTALIDHLQRAERCVTLLASLSHDGQAKLAFLAGPGADVDVRPALEAALAVLGGRGGGRPDRAQGAGEHGERVAEALAAARSALSHHDT